MAIWPNAQLDRRQCMAQGKDWGGLRGYTR
jgi:hypothetical protein